MSDTPTPPVNPRIEAIRAKRAKEQEDATAKSVAMGKLAANVKKTFTLGDDEFIVVGFEPDHQVGAVRGPAYLIQGSNPNRRDFVLVEDFLADYKEKV